MKNRRFQNYLQAKASGKHSESIRKKGEIQQNPDRRIDQDVESYPHGAASEDLIKPLTKTQKKVAAVDITDGEKINANPLKKKEKK